MSSLAKTTEVLRGVVNTWNSSTQEPEIGLPKTPGDKNILSQKARNFKNVGPAWMAQG